MKAFLCIGNQKLEEIIQEADIEIIDYEDNLNNVYDMLEFINMDYLIVNRLLDGEKGNSLVKIAKRAKEKQVKIIILTNDLESYSERKVVTNLVNENVTAFIKFDNLTSKEIERLTNEYPKEFDFSVFSDSKEKVAYKEVVKSVFKKVIAVYSPTSEGATTIAAHIAHVIAESQKCRVCLLDFNLLKPRVREIFDMTFEYNLEDLLDAVVRKNLTSTIIETYGRESKYIKNLDIIPGLCDLNEVYTTRKEDFEEIISKAKFSYDYVIIDTNSWFDLVSTDRALELADEVIVPVRGRNYSLSLTNRYLENFEKYNDFDIRKFKLVINNYFGEDLTSIEISSKTQHQIAGYISRYKEYDRLNGFKRKWIMNEYVPILKSIGIEAKKKKALKEKVFSLLPKKEAKEK